MKGRRVGDYVTYGFENCSTQSLNEKCLNYYIQYMNNGYCRPSAQDSQLHTRGSVGGST